MDKREKKRLAILDVLKNSHEPLPSAKINDTLVAQGFDVSERTVRLYLKEFDALGFTSNLGRKGRMITEAGIQETEESRVVERIGFLSGKIDTMAYRMNFDPATRTGTVVVNVSTVPIREITPYQRKMIAKVFSKGYAMGTFMTLFSPGSTFMGKEIPLDRIGIGTVCSITINGVLLRRGIPVHSRFGGLLELRDGHPTRFVELINYNGTSIDPLEVFIRSGMANYVDAVTTGNGRIGASFREFPAESVGVVRTVAERLEAIGLGSVMCIGNPGQTLFDIPVAPNRAGGVIIGGLNPMSIFEETGLRVPSSALAGLVEYDQLFHYSEFGDRLDQYLR